MQQPTFSPATKPQIQKINVLLNQLGLKSEKGTLVGSYSNERTTHISELSVLEARQLISFLINQSPKDRLKDAILALGYKIGFLYGDTPEDRQMNLAKLDRFLQHRGAVKKPFNELTLQELKAVQKQFYAMGSSNDYSKAGKAVKSLLNELGINVIKHKEG